MIKNLITLIFKFLSVLVSIPFIILGFIGAFMLAGIILGNDLANEMCESWLKNKK